MNKFEYFLKLLEQDDCIASGYEDLEVKYYNEIKDFMGEEYKPAHFNISWKTWFHPSKFNGTITFNLEGKTLDDAVNNLYNQIDELINAAYKFKEWLNKDQHMKEEYNPHKHTM